MQLQPLLQQSAAVSINFAEVALLELLESVPAPELGAGSKNSTEEVDLV